MSLVWCCELDFICICVSESLNIKVGIGSLWSVLIVIVLGLVYRDLSYSFFN